MAIAQTALSEIHWSLGELMWKARRNADLEQKDVAVALGVSRALVGHWENDRSEPSYRRLVKFAELTGFPLDALLSTIGYKSEIAGESPILALVDGQGKGPGRDGLPFLASV